MRAQKKELFDYILIPQHLCLVSDVIYDMCPF